VGLKTAHLSSEPLKARQAYFTALRKHWPELLESLRKNVLPKYRPRYWPGDEEMRVLFESWDELQKDAERRELLNAIQDWATHFRITEPWIFQTALDTLQGYSAYPNTPMGFAIPKGSERDWFWLYAPRDEYPVFRPQFALGSGVHIWSPRQEDWQSFRNRLTRYFTTQLNEYRRAVETRFTASDNLARDAEWTARYQKGEQAFEIAFGMTGYDDCEQMVYRAVDRFATSIGLNLRKLRRRRHGKR